MPEQIYDRAQLRQRALEHLRQADGHQTTGRIAAALGVQLWAVDQELEHAYLDGDAVFTAGAGWTAVAAV